MARCQITGKRALRGNKVSHANNHSIKWQHPNIQRKKIWVPELGRWVRIKVSVRAMRSITKMGLVPYCRAKGIDINTFL